MKIIPLMLLILASSIVGCKEEEVHDVDYYYKNLDECKKQLGKCQNNPGKLEDTPNCKNARAARHKRAFSRDGSTFKTPEMRTE